MRCVPVCRGQRVRTHRERVFVCAKQLVYMLRDTTPGTTWNDGRDDPTTASMGKRVKEIEIEKEGDREKRRKRKRRQRRYHRGGQLPCMPVWGVDAGDLPDKSFIDYDSDGTPKATYKRSKPPGN